MKSKLRGMFAVGSTNVRVLRGLGFVFCFMFLGKLAGLAKEVAIASRYGSGLSVDVYVFVFVLVSWIPLLFQSVGQSSLVPLLSRLDGKARGHFYSQLLFVTFFAGCVICFSVFLLSEEIVDTFGGAFSQEARIEASRFARTIAPCAVLLMLITVVSSELLSREKHANTLAEAIPAIVMFIFVLSWPEHRPSLEPFSVGLLVGLTIQLLVLLSVSSTNISTPLRNWRSSSSAWGDMTAAMSVLLVGSFVMGLAKPIDNILAVQFGEGAVSRLSYATRVLALGVGLGTTVVTRALLPVLSDRKYSLAKRLHVTRQWTAVILALSTCVTLIAWWCAPIAVATLFERGAFDSEDTRIVTTLVRYGLLQIPLVMAGMVLVQYFAGLGKFKVIAVSGIVGAVIKLACIVPLASWIGLAGIVLSSSIMYLASSGFLLWMSTKMVRNWG